MLNRKEIEKILKSMKLNKEAISIVEILICRLAPRASPFFHFSPQETPVA
ncbi:MAG: hypothetical protein Q6373_004885 [Candidatus Sigynarchaeota archaeon]